MLAELLTLPYSVAVDSAVLVYPLPSNIPVYDEADIALTLEESDGSVGFSPVLNTDYTVAISATSVATITFLANTELTAGRVLVVDRETERSQPVLFSELQDLPAAAIEKQLDRLVAMAQESTAKIKRMLIAPRNESLPELPSKSSLLGKILYLNLSGNSWDLMDASSVQLLADDLALGGASKVTTLAGLSDELTVLNALAAEIAALGAIPTELAAIYAQLTQLLVVAGAISDGTINDLIDNQIAKIADLAELKTTSIEAGFVAAVAGRASAGDGNRFYVIGRTDDRSADVTADPGEGRFIAPASDATGASGAWEVIIDAVEVSTGYNNLRAALEKAGTVPMRIPLAGGSDSVASSDPISVPDGAIIQGDKRGAPVSLTSTSAGTVEFIDFLGAAHLSNLKFALTVAATGTAQVFTPGDDSIFTGLEIDGGVTDTGGSASHTVHVFDMASNAFKRFVSAFNIFKNVSRIVLKTNADTNSHTGLRFLFDHYENMFTEAIALNSPHASSEMRDVIVMGNTRKEGLGGDVGLEAHAFGTASGKDIVFAFNLSIGKGDEVVHIEEAAERIVVMGNRGLFSNATSGIVVVDNNVSGIYETPKFLNLFGNILIRETRGTGNTALDIAPNGVGNAAIHDSVCTAGVISGWHRGVRTAEDMHRTLLIDHLIDDCDEALQVMRPSLTIRDHLIVDCDTGVELQSGGLVGHLTFTVKDPTTIFGASNVLIPTPVNPGVHKGGLTSWDVQAEMFTTYNGSQDYKIMPLGAALVGRITVAWYADTVGYRFATYEAHWDGTILTATLVGGAYGIGATALVDIRNDGAGNLAVRLNNTSGADKTNTRLQVTFEGGFHVFD